MSSAIQLTATATILNGNGLTTNANLTTALTTFQNLPTVTATANVFGTAAIGINTADPYLGTALGNLGSGITNNTLWMLDFYPANVTPVNSGTIGYVFQSNIAAGSANIANIASLSKTLSVQSQLPFANGMSGFANVFTTAYGYATSVFETVASIYMLQNKTYAQSGIGFANPSDLSTLGLAQAAPIIASTVTNWGTMYDVTKLNLIGDPYVFGQNLLNQGLGNYGNLADKLTAAGLDVNDITVIPPSTTTTTATTGTLTTQSTVGPVQLPTIHNITTTNTVTAISPSVVTGIYSSITGNDLASIVTATGISTPGVQINSLADYLTLSKVVTADLVRRYSALGIYTLNDAGSFIHKTLGNGFFATWHDIASALNSIQVPSFASNATNNTTGSSTVLSTTTISTLQNYVSSGTGPFNNPVMSDFLGASAGTGYTSDYTTLISSYNSINPATVVTALGALNSAVITYIAASSGARLGLRSTLSSAVSAVNTALNNLGNSTAITQATTSYYDITTRLANEVANINKAGVVFNSGTSQGLFSFAQNLALLFSDNIKIQTTQLTANVIANDVYGDTIRSAVAESINTQVLQRIGISVPNDPAPSQAVNSAQAQNLPLSTYLSQNK
jgi:hypothetical protein